MPCFSVRQWYRGVFLCFLLSLCVSAFLLPGCGEPEATYNVEKVSESNFIVETDSCFDNHAGYGFRNMVVTEDAMYLGTGSSFNMKAHGAWELYKMTTDD